METKKQWGMTPPLSVAIPTDAERKMNDTLIEELKAQKSFETEEETQRRYAVLDVFQKTAVEFVRIIGKKQGLAPSVIDNAGGKIFTFGSFRLGVQGPGSDIDALLVAPKHVSRDDFFEHFPQVLQRMSAPGAIEELTPVPDAFTPIIKIEYSGISIDLIFTRIMQSTVPMEQELTDNNILRGLDEFDLRCVNGVRVSDEMLALVPQVKTFRHTLRAIKIWAQRRAVYANVMGFPGGVTWAMMVARICQLYPYATASTVMLKFFKLMLEWNWPTPILLKAIEDGPLQVRIWNPVVYPGDKRHLMPVITPAYPSMCATHNVTHSTFAVIMRELDRGHKVVSDILNGNRPWRDLFERHSFFTKDYKNYFSIVAASRTKEAQQIWSGFVQSRVRRLVSNIENADAGVAVAHPYVKGFERVHRCKSDDEVEAVLKGNVQYQVTETKTTDESNDVKQNAAAQSGAATMEMPTQNGHETNEDGSMMMYTTTFYVGLELAEGARSLDLSHPTSEFKRICTDWPQYNPDLNSVRVVHTKSYDLPADVFEAGETRPTRPKKKIGKGHEKAKKRGPGEAGINDAAGHIKRHRTNGVAASTPEN